MFFKSKKEDKKIDLNTYNDKLQEFIKSKQNNFSVTITLFNIVDRKDIYSFIIKDNKIIFDIFYLDNILYCIRTEISEFCERRRISDNCTYEELYKDINFSKTQLYSTNNDITISNPTPITDYTKRFINFWIKNNRRLFSPEQLKKGLLDEEWNKEKTVVRVTINEKNTILVEKENITLSLHNKGTKVVAISSNYEVTVYDNISTLSVTEDNVYINRDNNLYKGTVTIS